MKNIFTLSLLLSCSFAFGQQVVTHTQGTMTPAEFNAKHPAITDPKIYDISGNVVDSVKAGQMTKTFDYELVRGKPNGQIEEKRLLIKINAYKNANADKGSRITFRPKNPKLWEGATLDLSPLAKHTDLDKLQGKAIVLLFRSSQYPAMYSRVNDAIANNMAASKFEAFAITDLSYEDALKAQKQDPILNAHNIVDARSVTDFYGTTGEALIIVTNTQHQITYAVTGWVFTTPWVLNGLLKALQ